MKKIKFFLILILSFFAQANQYEIKSLLILKEISETVAKLPSDSYNEFLVKVFRTQKNIDKFNDPNSVSLEIKAISYYANLLTKIIPQYTSLQNINNTNLKEDVLDSIYVKNVHYYLSEFQKHSKNLNNKADFVIALYNIERMYKIFKQLLLSQSYDFLNTKINRFNFPPEFESIANDSLFTIFNNIDSKSNNITYMINSLLNEKENYLMNFSKNSVKNFKDYLKKYGYSELLNRYYKINNNHFEDLRTDDIEETFSNIETKKKPRKKVCTEVYPGITICHYE